MRLLTQNGELKPEGIWNWTLPAHVVTLDDGTKYNVCPEAQACVALCYARQGAYIWPQVAAAHLANLRLTLEPGLGTFTRRMLADLNDAALAPPRRRSRRARPVRVPPDGMDDPWLERWYGSGWGAVRIHDAGDFHSDPYLARWVGLARARPEVLFYAYTKEVSRVRRVVPHPPPNFRVVFSLGGREDHLLDLDVDRHAEVFPDDATLEAAGYLSQDPSDLWCVALPTTRVGIPQNRLPAVRKRLGARTFGQVQAERDGRTSTIG